MGTLILLRHGRTTANAAGILAGDLPAELDEQGRAQATAVGERLAGVRLATVVTSPLLRCRQTLELALPGAVPEVDPRLTECGYGEWAGRPLKELAEDPLWSVVQQHPSAVTFPGGESMPAMSARAAAAVRARDAALEPDAVWLACSHGDIIKSIVADALGLHLDLFQRINVEPASLTLIRYTPARAYLLRLNDVGGDLRPLVDPTVGGAA